MNSNLRIADVSSRNAMDYLQDLDSETLDMSPMIHFFTEDYESPIMVIQLPPSSEDKRELMFHHMFAVPFINLLPIRAVSIVQDTWFTKAEKGEEINVRPSESIDREQGLVTLVIKDDDTGVFNMREYGRDDNGIIYTKDVTNTEIENWSDEESHASWVVPMMQAGFHAKENQDITLETTEKMLALMEGFNVLNDGGFQYLIHMNMKDIIADTFQEISDTDVYKSFIKQLEEGLKEYLEEE